MKARLRIDTFIAWSPIFLLGALAALTYWLDAQIRPPPAAYDGSTRHDPDVYIENFHAVNLDKDGSIRQALTAKLAQHYPDDDSTSFQSPQIAFTEPGKPRLDVTAERGKISGDRETAIFEGKVKAVRQAVGSEGPVTFTSDFLRVIPKQDKVVTDKPVTIADSHGIINATGMEFNNKTKVVRFQSRISGQFLPQQ